MDLGLHEDDDEFVEKDPTGRYLRYNEILGRGAFKTVYKGFDEVNGTEVAWSEIEIDEAFLNSRDQIDILFSEEINLLKSLKHENIMKYFYSWIDEGKKKINMITEVFTSGSLSNYRKKHKNVEIKAIKNWARQILKGLHYLHSHNPPIIHRDLKCDNVFVNGNNGEVKIGDFGLALVMNRNQDTAPSVMVGTPEFMAPELFNDEEYNELADIYSFGMCMLEMITCEYPYSECKNTAQVYKKVISGVKPACLSKVHDPQVQKFIEKCLVPASKRLSAIELLNDPFLATGNSKNVEISASPQSVSCSRDIGINLKDMKISGLEFQRISGNFEFRLRGEKIDDDAIAFLLCIIGQLSGEVNKINFSFYLDSDTSLSIAEEMIEELNLSNKDVGIIAEMIDALIMKLVPGRSPSLESSYSSEVKISSLEFQRFTEKFEFRLRGENPDVDDTVSCFLRIIDMKCGQTRKIEFSYYLHSDTSVSIAEGMNEELHLFQKLDLSNKDATTMIIEMIDALITKIVPQDFLPLPKMKGQEARDSFSSDSTITSLATSIKLFESSDFSSLEYTSESSSGLMMHGDDKSQESSGTSLPLENRDEEEELKLELDSIDMHYNQCFQELLRKKEEAIRSAKKKWIPTIKMPVSVI